MLLFLPHGCHWELQCEMGCVYLRQIYIIHEVKDEVELSLFKLMKFDLNFIGLRSGWGWK